jgi:hypothetical protein
MNLDLNKKKNFETLCGIVISFFTFILIIESIYTNIINTESDDARMDLSSNYDFYQAKKNRQVMYQIANDKYEVDALNPNNTPAQKETIKKFITKYKQIIHQYETDPDLQDGKSEIMAKIEENKHVLSENDKKILWLVLAESLLQISIVLLSVSLIIGSIRFLMLGVCLGAMGICSGINAIFLFLIF